MICYLGTSHSVSIHPSHLSPSATGTLPLLPVHLARTGMSDTSLTGFPDDAVLSSTHTILNSLSLHVVARPSDRRPQACEKPATNCGWT